jgi:hypothetical protein
VLAGYGAEGHARTFHSRLDDGRGLISGYARVVLCDHSVIECVRARSGLCAVANGVLRAYLSAVLLDSNAPLPPAPAPTSTTTTVAMTSSGIVVANGTEAPVLTPAEIIARIEVCVCVVLGDGNVVDTHTRARAHRSTAH